MKLVKTNIENAPVEVVTVGLREPGPSEDAGEKRTHGSSLPLSSKPRRQESPGGHWVRGDVPSLLEIRAETTGNREVVMNEDTFNMEVRKFLKQLGITAQREIESAVHRAVEAGRLKGNEKLKASARVQIEGIGLDHRVEGEISLS